MTSSTRKTLFIGIFIFLFVYSPPIFSINMLYIIAGISYINIFLFYRKKIISILSVKGVFLFILGISVALLLGIISIFYNGGDYRELNQITSVLILVFPTVIYIILYFEKHGYYLYDILKILLNCALFQSMISIIMFLFPEIREIMVNAFYESFTDESTSFWYRHRANGFSQSLLYAMPITQGFLAVIAFLLYIKGFSRYLIYIPFLLFSAAINARTGLLVFTLGSFLILVINLYKIKLSNILKLLVFAFVMSFLIPLSINIIESESQLLSNWLKDAVDETILFINGENTGYYKAADNMFFLPNKYEILAGTGEHYYGGNNIDGRKSDIGYVNDLFLGGIFFVIVLYASFTMIMLSGIQKDDFIRNLIYVMVLTIFIVNIKGFAFRQNVFTNLFLLLSLMIIYLKHKKNEIKSSTYP